MNGNNEIFYPKDQRPSKKETTHSKSVTSFTFGWLFNL